MSLSLACCAIYAQLGSSHHILRPAYIGPASGLKETIVVAALEQSIPVGMSAIWCATTGLAWTKLKHEVFKAPIEIANGGDVVADLNRREISEQDVGPEAAFLYAGRGGPEALRLIRAGLASKFPGLDGGQRGWAPDQASDWCAFAFLWAHVSFTQPFFERGLVFKGTDGRQTRVGGFGLRGRDTGRFPALHDQVEVWRSAPDAGGAPAEYALDPCRKSERYRLILASIAPGESLAKDLARVSLLMRQTSTHLNYDDRLAIPNQSWEITHDFPELSGRVLNPGFGDKTIAHASRIRFYLDRCGADLKADHVGYAILGQHGPSFDYQFNRPFFLCVENRVTRQPLLAMWVANLELLDWSHPMGT